MISRESLLLILAASQAQQAWSNNRPKHLVALGLAFLFSITHLNRAKREVIQKSITSQSSRPFALLTAHFELSSYISSHRYWVTTVDSYAYLHLSDVSKCILMCTDRDIHDR